VLIAGGRSTSWDFSGGISSLRGGVLQLSIANGSGRLHSTSMSSSLLESSLPARMGNEEFLRISSCLD